MQGLEKLKDIKGIVDIPDISYYIFLSIVLLVVILSVISIVYLLNMIKNQKKSKRKYYISKLKNIDFSDSKKAAYEITKYARKVADTKQSKGIFEQLLKELDRYKYVKNPPKFSKESKKYLQLFLEVCCG